VRWPTPAITAGGMTWNERATTDPSQGGMEGVTGSASGGPGRRPCGW